MLAKVNPVSKSAIEPKIIFSFNRVLNGLDVKYYYSTNEVHLIKCIDLIHTSSTPLTSAPSTLIIYPQGTNNNLLFRNPSQAVLLTNLMRHIEILSTSPL
jgi:hypothetical protein